MTIVRRGSRFGVKVWDPGKGDYRWIGTYATEREAIQAERDAALRPAREVPTVEQWCRIWLSDYARPAQATQRTYRYATEEIRRDVGKRKLDDIDRPLARRLANRWPRGTTRVARTMWADATRDGVGSGEPVHESPPRDAEGEEGPRCAHRERDCRARQPSCWLPRRLRA